MLGADVLITVSCRIEVKKKQKSSYIRQSLTAAAVKEKGLDYFLTVRSYLQAKQLPAIPYQTAALGSRVYRRSYLFMLSVILSWCWGTS